MKLRCLMIGTFVFPLTAMDVAVELPQKPRSVQEYLTEFEQVCKTNNPISVEQFLAQPANHGVIHDCNHQHYQQLRNCIHNMKLLRWQRNTVNAGIVGSAVAMISLLIIDYFGCYQYQMSDEPLLCNTFAPSELSFAALGYGCILTNQFLHDKIWQRKKALYIQLENARNSTAHATKSS